MCTREHFSTGWILLAMAALFLLASVRAQAQLAPGGVPDPSLMLAIAPDAANAGPPPCIRTGTRLTYFGMSASIPGEYKQLVQDEHGRWVDQQTGQRYSEQDIPGTSGGGYNVLYVGYVDNQVVQLASKFYLLDVGSKTCMYSFGGGLVAHAGCAADYWIHPAVLQKIPDVNRPGMRILRMPYTVGGRQFNAIRFETEDMKGYQARVYDLESGLLIFHGSRTLGPPVRTPPIGGSGRGGAGQGSTQVTTGWIVEVKSVGMPWRNASPPAWVGQFQRLVYNGSQTSVVRAAGSRLERPLTLVISPKARGAAWVRYTNSMTIQSLRGMPPEQSSWDGACGVGSLGGLWISPPALAALRSGQVLERNELVNTTTTVSRIGGGSVTLTEAGPRHRVDCTYDAGTGVLSATTITQQIGLATLTHRVQLAR